MSLFRRKQEDENLRDERLPAQPDQAPARGEQEPDSPLADGERSPGAIVAPAAGEIVSGLVEVRVAASEGEAGKPSLEWSADETSWQRVAGEERAEAAGAELLRWDTSALSDGSYLLRLVTTFSDGAEVASEPVPVLADNLGPEISLREPLEGRALSGSVTVIVDAEDSVSGVAQVELELCGEDESWRPAASAREQPFALRLESEELEDGSYRLRISARDGSGNVSRSEPWAIEVANTLGPAELVDPGRYLRGRVNLIARAPDKRSTQMVFEIASAGTDDWRALGTARAPFHLPVDTRRLLDGSYELRIESLTADDRSTYSKRFGPFVVDNTPPAVAIVRPREGATLENWVELVATASDDASGTERVELSYAERGEWRPLAELEPRAGEVRGFWQPEGCPPGSCRLRARAVDRAGNEASHVITVTIARPAPKPAPEPEPEEAAVPEPAREPVQRPAPAPEATRRFGEVPSWNWERSVSAGDTPRGGAEDAPTEPEEVVEPEEQPALEEEIVEAAVEPERPEKGIAWSWKSPAPDVVEAREAVEAETAPGPAPEAAPERAPEPEEKPEPERTITPAISPVESVGAEEDEQSTETELQEEKKPAAAGGEEGGRVFNLPRGARGWDIWELSDLVEKTPDQDPILEEERRRILYHLREHTAVDGRISHEFDALIYEAFGELLGDDSSA